MTEQHEAEVECPHCRTQVKVPAAPPGLPTKTAMRLRFDTLGTQIQCPHCGQPFVHRAKQSQSTPASNNR